jgi:DNA-binding CsgD family transcriptional regulator
MMPHRFTTPLLLLLLLTACTDSREQQLQLEELERQNRADSVMQDLALAQSLADHFDRHGTRNEQLRAHYILGRTHADRGDLPQAVAAYNDAADRADTTAQDCDYRTLSRVHTQLAQLYYSQLLPDNMIREERRAMRYAEMAKDTMQYLYCYGMLAEGYEMKDMKDSALIILTETYTLYNKVGATQFASALCCSMADICRRQNDYAQAEKYMREFETQSGFFDELGNIARGKEMYYSCKGHLCLDTSDKVNAEYYFRKLLSVANNYDLEIAALDGLQQFYAKYHNRDSLVKYDRLSDSICRIAHNVIEMQKIIQVQAMYDYTRSEQIAHQKEQEADRYKIFSALSAILILLFVIAYIHNRDEKQRLRDRIRLLSGYAVNKNLYDSPIAQHFRELLKANPYQNPSMNDWKELAALIESEIPNFREKLQTDSHQLSDNEYDICMLIKIQTSCSEIARLKQCSRSNVTHIRERIFKQLFSKNGKADELDEYIMSLS